MDVRHLSFVGPSLDDVDILPRLSRPYVQLLASQNGFVAFNGGLHVRGAVLEPQWHSIRAALEGPDALHKLFDVLTPTDIPFAQDAVGDQFILRSNLVSRLDGETGTLQSLNIDLDRFLDACDTNPVGFLRLQPLLNFQTLGGVLAPGQLLSVYPPFLIQTKANERSYAAVPAAERIRMLAGFMSETRSLPDGTDVRIKVPPDGA